MNPVTYKITNFDAEKLLLDVVFEDGGWARISLTAPLPESPEDIDEIVKRFTAPVEHLEAKQSSVSLAYIDTMLGVPRTTARYSIAGKNTPKTPKEQAAELAATEAAASEIEAMEVAKLRRLFDQFMAEREAAA